LLGGDDSPVCSSVGGELGGCELGGLFLVDCSDGCEG